LGGQRANTKDTKASFSKHDKGRVQGLAVQMGCPIKEHMLSYALVLFSSLFIIEALIQLTDSIFSNWEHHQGLGFFASNEINPVIENALQPSLIKLQNNERYCIHYHLWLSIVSSLYMSNQPQEAQNFGPRSKPFWVFSPIFPPRRSFDY
jgi:hypothetical protein